MVEVAHRFSGVVRAGDVLARFGGDEFIVMCPAIDREQGVRALCSRLIDSFEPVFTETPEVRVGATVGAILIPPGAVTDPGQVLRQADDLLMARKEEQPGQCADASSLPQSDLANHFAKRLYAEL